MVDAIKRRLGDPQLVDLKPDILVSQGSTSDDAASDVFMFGVPTVSDQDQQSDKEKAIIHLESLCVLDVAWGRRHMISIVVWG